MPPETVTALVALAFAVAAAAAGYALGQRRATSRASGESQFSQLVFDGTSDLMSILRVETDGRLVFEYINRSLREFHRVARPEVSTAAWIGRDLADVMLHNLRFTAAQTENVLEPYREAVRSRRSMPVSHVTGDGAQRRFREGVITPIVDAQGRVQRLFYRGTDITARRQAELELRGSAERFSSLLSHSPIGIVITSIAEGRFVEVNETYCRLIDWEREDLLGRTTSEMTFWDSAEQRRAALKPVLERGEFVQFERSFASRKGRQLHVVMSAGPIEFEGRPCILSMLQDVTEQFEARARENALTMQFAGVFDLAPNPLAISELDTGRFLEVNQAWCALYGWSREDAVGRTSFELNMWSEPADRIRLQAIMQREKRVRQTTVRFRTRQGRLVSCVVSGDAIEWQGRRVLLSSHHDLSEIETAQREVRALGERFAALFRASPVPIVVTRLADGMALEVNEAHLRVSGYRREDIVGRTTAQLGTWVDPAERKRVMDMLRSGTPVRGVPVRFHNKRREVREFLLFAEIIEWDGEPALVSFPYDVSELQAARREAQAMGERFALLFDTSPVASAISSMNDGRYIAVNNAWCATTGWSREEVIGRTALQLRVWTDEKERQAVHAKISADGYIRQQRASFRNRAGEERDFLYSGERIDWNGEAAHLSTRVDVTEIERLRREAQALSQRFVTLFEASPVPILVTRLKGAAIVHANPAWYRFSGHNPETIASGTTTVDLGLWPELAQRAQAMRILGRPEPVRQLPVKLRRADGEIRDVLYSAEIIQWDEEKAIIAFPVDITELEQVRREAQASGERFAKVFELSPTPIVIGAVGDGTYLAANEAWLRLHGYAREELEGHGSVSLGVWADPADRSHVVDMLTRGLPVRGLPVRFLKKSGEAIETLYSAAFIDWKGGRAIVATPQDVTALNRATARIRQLNESLEEKVAARTAALEEANRELESFSYSVSHDLRAPLRALSGFAALLARHRAVGSDAEARGYAERISGAATRMGTIVDALLHYSRLSRQAVSLGSFDLEAEVRALAQDLDAGSARPIRWSIGPLPQVRGDPTLLRLVIQNLMDNAVKYSRGSETPHIEIGAEQSADETIVHVRDNGVGFDMAHAAQLFGVFQRLHTDAEFEGTGIGLANAQRIVQRHGGRIWCHAEPGRGATFCFSLPRHESQKS